MAPKVFGATSQKISMMNVRAMTPAATK